MSSSTSIKGASQVEGLQACPYVVGFRVGSHELILDLQPVAHQLRLAQIECPGRTPSLRCASGCSL